MRSEVHCLGERTALLQGAQEGLPEIDRGLEPPLGVLLQGLDQKDLDAHGNLHLWVRLGEPRHRVVDVRQHGLHGRRPHEGGRAGQHFIEHDSQGVQVAGRPHRVAQRLLGTQVLRRADDHAGTGHRLYGFVVHQFGDAEVEYSDLFLVVLLDDEQVVRLQVSVQDTLVVRFLERLTCLQHQPRRPVGIERPFLLNEPGDGVSFEQFHGVVDQSFPGHSEVVQGNGVAATQFGDGRGLREEALDQAIVLHHFPAQHLERNTSLDEVLLRLVDHPHPTSTDLPQHVVAIFQHLANEVPLHGGNEVRAVFATPLSRQRVFLEAFWAVLLHISYSLYVKRL